MTYTELFHLLCFQYKVVSVEYFLDRLEEWELVPILSGLQYTDRNSWEQTRLRIYTLSSMFSKQQRALQDIMTFPWEGITEEHTTEMSDDDRIRLKARAEAIAKTMK